MKVLVGYGTNEGQTRRIARRVADRAFDAGHAVELLELTDADDLDLARFDRIVVAGSIHTGHYQRGLTSFVAKRAAELNARPTLFLSVSLAAAGHDAEEWKALDRILEEVVEATGWTPGRVEQVAGAYRPSEYDMFCWFIMRRIISAKDPEADLDADKEYTDWAALDSLTDAWLAEGRD